MHFLLFFLVILCCRPSDAFTSTKFNYLPNGQVGGYELIINNTVQPRIQNLPRDRVPSKIVKHTSNVGRASTRVDEEVIGEDAYLKVHRVLQQNRMKYPVKAVLMVPSVGYVNGVPEMVKLRFAQIGPYAALIVPVNKSESSADSVFTAPSEISNSVKAYVEVQEPPSPDQSSQKTNYPYAPPTYEIPSSTESVSPATTPKEIPQQPENTGNYIYPGPTSSISDPTLGTPEIENDNNNGFVIRVVNPTKGAPNSQDSRNKYQEFFVPARPAQFEPERDDKIIANPFRYSGSTGPSTSQFREVYSKGSPSTYSSVPSGESGADLKDLVKSTTFGKQGISNSGKNSDSLGAQKKVDQEKYSDNGHFQSGWSLDETQDPKLGYNSFIGPPPGQPEFSDVSPSSDLKNLRSQQSGFVTNNNEQFSNLRYGSVSPHFSASKQPFIGQTDVTSGEGQTSNVRESSSASVNLQLDTFGPSYTHDAKQFTKLTSHDTSSTQPLVGQDASSASQLNQLQDITRQNLDHISHGEAALVAVDSAQRLNQFQSQKKGQVLNAGHRNIALTNIDGSGNLPLIDNEKFKSFIRNPSLNTELNFLSPNGQTAAVLTSTGDSAKVDLPSRTPLRGQFRGNIIIPKTVVPLPISGGGTSVDYKEGAILLNSKYNQQGSTFLPVGHYSDSFDGLRSVQNNVIGSSVNLGNQQQNNVFDSTTKDFEQVSNFGFDSAAAAAAAAAAVKADNEHFITFDTTENFQTDHALLSDTVNINQQLRPYEAITSARRPGLGNSEIAGVSSSSAANAASNGNKQILTSFNSGGSSFEYKYPKGKDSVSNEYTEEVFTGSDVIMGGQSTSPQSELSEGGGRTRENLYSQFKNDATSLRNAGYTAEGSVGNTRVNFALAPESRQNEVLLSTANGVNVNVPEVSGGSKLHANIVIPKYQLPLENEARIPIDLQDGANLLQSNHIGSKASARIRPVVGIYPSGSASDVDHFDQFESTTLLNKEQPSTFDSINPQYSQFGTSAKRGGQRRPISGHFSSVATEGEAAAAAAATTANAAAVGSQRILADTYGGPSFGYKDERYNEFNAQLTRVPTFTHSQLSEDEHKFEKGHLSSQFLKDATTSVNVNSRAQGPVGDSHINVALAPGVRHNAALFSSPNDDTVDVHIPESTVKSQQHGEIIPKYLIPEVNKAKIPINLQTGGSAKSHDSQPAPVVGPHTEGILKILDGLVSKPRRQIPVAT